jgi:NAD-dependent dihydropyrimidine dehydrogenase PreA subunit
VDVIYFHPDEGVVEIRYPDECWHCGSCRQDCPAGAIKIVFPPIMANV